MKLHFYLSSHYLIGNQKAGILCPQFLKISNAPHVKIFYTSESEKERKCIFNYTLFENLFTCSILWSESEMAKKFSQIIFPPLGTTRKLAGIAELVRFVQQKHNRNIGMIVKKKKSGGKFHNSKRKKIYKIYTWRSLFKKKIMICVLKVY